MDDNAIIELAARTAGECARDQELPPDEAASAVVDAAIAARKALEAGRTTSQAADE